MNSTEPETDRLILRGALSTAGGYGIRFGARLLFLFLAGRQYGAVIFGAYSLGVAVVEASLGLTGLSLKKTLFQMLDRNKATDAKPAFHIVIDAAILLATVSIPIAGFIMAAAATLPRSVLPEATSVALFWLAPMLVGQGLADILLTATRWKHAIRYEVIGRSLVEPYSLLAGAAVSYFAGFAEYGLIIGYWAGTVGVNLYAAVGAKRCFATLEVGSYRPRLHELTATMRWLLPNAGTDLLSAIYSRTDLYLVGILLGERWAGIYSMAQQVRTPVRQVRQSIDALLIPVVAKTLVARGAVATGRALATTARFILAVQTAFLLAIFVIGAQLLEVLGPGFGVGYWALVLLMIAEVIQGTFGLGDLLFVYLVPHVGLRMALIAFAIGVCGAIILIPLLGITGAAAAMLIAISTQALLRRIALKSRFETSVPLSFSFPPLIAGLIGFAASLLARALGSGVSGLSVAITLLAALGAYGVALGAWLFVSGESLSIRGFATEPQSFGLQRNA